MTLSRGLLIAMVATPFVITAILFAIPPSADEPPPRAPEPPRPRYVENRATVELARRGYRPGLEREVWTGDYEGPLAVSSASGLSFHYRLDEQADGTIALVQPGVLRCTLVRSPDNPNLAACSGSYVVVDPIYFDIGAAIAAGRLQIVVITADGEVQGTRVPGTTVSGALSRK